MVLSLMRKHAQSWIIKFLIAMIAVVFIFYFGYSFRSDKGLKVASVNGEPITGIEYQKAYLELVESYRRQYQQFWNEDLIKSLNLRQQALDNLINAKLISQEARRLGLDVTDREIQDAIARYPAFQVNGRFDLSRYRSLLSFNRMEPEDFEADMARQLLQGKLRQFLAAFAVATDEEILERYTYENEKVKIAFVAFKPETFKKGLTPEPNALETYYAEHKEAYRVPEKIKLVYAVIDPADFDDMVQITDTDIESYYEYNIETFKQPKEVKARHILFRLPQEAAPEQEEEVKARAAEVLAQARQGKDFAELAKQYSEGPTRESGGDLGYFSRGRMVKDFEDAAFALGKGEISDLVRTPFGYHIIKVEDIREARTKPLEEVRAQILETLRQNARTDLAHEKGLSLMDQMPYDVNLEEYASEHKLKTGETGLFSQDQPIPELGGDLSLRESLFALEPGQTSELVELGGKFYIFQVTDRQASAIPEMAAVIDKVREDVLREKAAQKAKEAAEAFLAALKKGADWDTLARDKGLEPQESGLFTRLENVPEIGFLPELQEAAFSLSPEHPYPDRVFESDRGVFVVRWTAREGIDDEAFQKDKEKMRNRIMQEKQAMMMTAWLERIKARAEIEVLTPVS